MSKTVQVRRRSARQERSAAEAFFLGGDCFAESLEVRGYTSLLQSPDVANAVDAVADIVSNASIHLMRNTGSGDVRVRDNLSKFMDIHPYSLGTRKSFISWIVTYLLTTGDGNAFVFPKTRDGLLEDLVPMPGASIQSTDTGYVVWWRGRVYQPDEILHFVERPDPMYPWLGRGVRIQLKDVLRNLKQSSATTNRFLTDKWKPSVIVKVDALADEFAGKAGRHRLLAEYLEGQEAGEPWIIPADLMDVTQVKPLSLADLAISDSVELDKRAVASAIGVPSFLLGIGSFNREEYNNFIRRRILPLANSIAQELSKKLLYSPDLYFRVNSRKLYAYSLTELARVADDQYTRGLMTGNEARKWLDLPPKDGLDELVMLENYIPAGMIADQKKLYQED